MIRFDCPSCGKKIKTEESNAGKTGMCPRCNKKFVVSSVFPRDEPLDLGFGIESHPSRSATAPLRGLSQQGKQKLITIGVLTAIGVGCVLTVMVVVRAFDDAPSAPSDDSLKELTNQTLADSVKQVKPKQEQKQPKYVPLEKATTGTWISRDKSKLTFRTIYKKNGKLVLEIKEVHGGKTSIKEQQELVELREGGFRRVIDGKPSNIGGWVVDNHGNLIEDSYPYHYPPFPPEKIANQELRLVSLKIDRAWYKLPMLTVGSSKKMFLGHDAEAIYDAVSERLSGKTHDEFLTEMQMKQKIEKLMQGSLFGDLMKDSTLAFQLRSTSFRYDAEKQVFHDSYTPSRLEHLQYREDSFNEDYGILRTRNVYFEFLNVKSHVEVKVPMVPNHARKAKEWLRTICLCKLIPEYLDVDIEDERPTVAERVRGVKRKSVWKYKLQLRLIEVWVVRIDTGEILKKQPVK